MAADAQGGVLIVPYVIHAAWETEVGYAARVTPSNGGHTAPPTSVDSAQIRDTAPPIKSPRATRLVKVAHRLSIK